jgi:hypothetical protein
VIKNGDEPITLAFPFGLPLRSPWIGTLNEKFLLLENARQVKTFSTDDLKDCLLKIQIHDMGENS